MTAILPRRTQLRRLASYILASMQVIMALARDTSSLHAIGEVPCWLREQPPGFFLTQPLTLVARSRQGMYIVGKPCFFCLPTLLPEATVPPGTSLAEPV